MPTLKQFLAGAAAAASPGCSRRMGQDRRLPRHVCRWRNFRIRAVG